MWFFSYESAREEGILWLLKSSFQSQSTCDAYPEFIKWSCYYYFPRKRLSWSLNISFFRAALNVEYESSIFWSFLRFGKMSFLCMIQSILSNFPPKDCSKDCNWSKIIFVFIIKLDSKELKDVWTCVLSPFSFISIFSSISCTK